MVVGGAEGANIAFMVLINLVLWKTLGCTRSRRTSFTTTICSRGGGRPHRITGRSTNVTFNVGFHVEHHDFMNIPGSRLPEYRALIDGEYRDLVSMTRGRACWRTSSPAASWAPRHASSGRRRLSPPGVAVAPV